MDINIKGIICIFLSILFVSCGGGDNKVVTSPREKNNDRLSFLPKECAYDSSNETWKNFREKVTRGEGFLSVSGWGVEFLENVWKTKEPHCGTFLKGIIHYCSGSHYRFPKGLQERRIAKDNNAKLLSLRALVADRPSNFEARICDGKMFSAQIAITGKGGVEKFDTHRFDFSVPLVVNPVYSSVWEDSRRNNTTQRQYLRPVSRHP